MKKIVAVDFVTLLRTTSSTLPPSGQLAVNWDETELSTTLYWL